MKICNKFVYTCNHLYLSTTLMKTSELYTIEKDELVSDLSRMLYQCKVCLLLFAAIATRPNIAFAISCLSRFNQ